ncbi:helix-turn-helix transcriptional regulator [Pseudomonas fluorescens]|uniref:helix-turn-helix transcriptional regulator n=1 Tax=Pseudomonas fluorescens TaxID=294 RepID=UPI002966326E|nr:AlpA family phage regulatory protein [Pseudomonas fluorescens]
MEQLSMSKLDRFMRERDVIAVTSLSHSTIWRAMKVGRFPRPVLISPGRVGWRESSIVAWQKSPSDWKVTDFS